MASTIGRVDIGGNPTADEVAAIVAAIEAVWPDPAPAARPRQDHTAWRYSGRWWRAGRLPDRWH